MFYKKGFYVVTAVTLLILISVLSSFILYNFFIGKQNLFISDIERVQEKGDIEIGDIQYVNNAISVLTLKNSKNPTNVSKIFVNGRDCNIIASTSEKDSRYLYLDCPVNLNKSYSIDLISDIGLRDITKTVYNEFNGLVFTYRLGTKNCEVGEVKILGFGADENAHVETANDNVLQGSLCASHLVFNLENSCQNSFVKLFDLAKTGNSHVWVDNSSALKGPRGDYVFSWNPVCVSSSDSSIADVYYGVNPPSKQYSCAVSILRDDYYGGVIGSCNKYVEKVWVLLN